MRLPLACVTFLLLVAGSSAENLDFNRALEIAIRQSPVLNAVREEVAAEQNLLSAARRPAPMDVRLAPALTTGGTDEELTVIQPLEINGARRARARLAAAESALTLAKAKVDLNLLLADVATAYLEAAYRERLLQLAREALQNAEQTVHLVRQQIQAGVRPGIDLVQVEIEAERIRLQNKKREAEAQAARARLNALLGYPQDTQHVLAPVSPALFGEEEKTSPILSPEVVQEQALLSIYERETEQIRVEGIPDLGVQLRVERWTGSRTRPGLGITLSLPFLDYGARQKRLQAQHQLASAQRLRLQATQQRLAAEQTRARLLLEAARTRWQAYEQEVLPRVEQLARSVQTGLETGAMNILQVLEAQRTVRLSREEAVEAELQLALAWVESQRVRGYFACVYYPIWKEARP
ncbi:Cobalt-zinc-cadmium resistance protein CzcC [bacterium HR16]|nr:Cobalt-zinc-cadmium resistance protein CzcC [bacterium HR16]